MGLFSRTPDPDPEVPQTITADEWNRITKAAAKQTPSPLSPEKNRRQEGWTASARQSAWN